MLVVDGFFENNVFTPKNPVVRLNGRKNAKLFVEEYCEEQILWKQKELLLENQENFERELEMVR
jgi:hypothetical protein